MVTIDTLRRIRDLADRAYRFTIWDVPCPNCGQRAQHDVWDHDNGAIVCLASHRGDDVACAARLVARDAAVGILLADIVKLCREAMP